MTPLNDDLVRAALSDGAGSIGGDDLRPLAPPGRPGRRRWTIPAGAALVALAAVLAVAVPRLRGTVEPAMSLAAYAGAKYVVTGAWPNGGKELTIHEVATGRTVARVPAPQGSSGFLDAAGAGDNRTFFLTTADAATCRVFFHRLVLRENGTPARLNALPELTLPGRQGEGPDQLAVARGGGRLAYSTMGCGARSSRARITIVDPRTGARRDVALPTGARADDLRWGPDGRLLTFRLAGNGRPGYELYVFDSVDGVRTRVALGPPGTRWNVGVVAPDGTHVVAVVTTGRQRRMVWYSLSAKTVTHQVPLPPGSPGDPIVSVGGTGGELIVMIGDRLYRVHGTNLEDGHVRADAAGPSGTW